MASMMDLSNELGSAALDRGDFKEARKQFKFMVRESLKHGEAEQAVAQNRLGTACTREGRFKEAEEAFRASVNLTEGAYGPTHPSVSAELNNLAYVLWKGLGDKVAAKQLFEKAVELVENAMASASEVSPIDREIFSGAFENIATFLEEQRDFATAEQMLRKAVKVQVDGAAANSPAHTRPLMQLVKLLDKQGRQQEARELMEEHLAAAQKALSAGPIAE